MKTHSIVTFSLLMISVCSIAQDRTSPVGVMPSIAVMPPMSGTPGDYSAQIMGVQYDFPGAVVTGAPYAADLAEQRRLAAGLQPKVSVSS